MRGQLNQYQSYLSQLNPDDPSTQDLYQQIQYTAASLENQLEPNLAVMLGKQVLDSMIEETFIRQEAKVRGLTASEDEIALSMEQMLGYDRTATDTITDTANLPSFDELYQDFRDNILKMSNFSEDKYRATIEANVLRDKLKDSMGQDIELTADQIETVFLTTDNEEAALTFRQRIKEGEPAESILEELNSDESDATAGYTLPWLPMGYLGPQLGEDIEKVAFNTPVGQASDPTLGNDGKYYVIYISGHEERELSDSLLAQEREERYKQWLDQQQQERVEYFDWQDAVLTKP
jgi:parvulin-like peptidyl-prolyl isomerase